MVASLRVTYKTMNQLNFEKIAGYDWRQAQAKIELWNKKEIFNFYFSIQ